MSLVPSVTETLSGWGLDPVGCTRFCERPDITHVGGTKDPSVSAILALGPDLVVLDAEENRIEDHDELVSRGVHVLALHVRSLDDVPRELGRLAREVGVSFEPVPWPAPARPARRALVPIWRRPWMALGSPTYGTSLLTHLGVENVMAGRGAYPTFEMDDIRSLSIDLVIAPSEPYPFRERHRGELEGLAPVVFVDGRDMFWWGSRTTGAMERLGAVIAQNS